MWMSLARIQRLRHRGIRPRGLNTGSSMFAPSSPRGVGMTSDRDQPPLQVSKDEVEVPIGLLGAHECETAEPPLSAMTGSGIPHSAPTAGSLGMTRMERGRQVEPGHSLLSVLWYLMSGLYLLITEVAISMVHCVERGVHNSGAPRTVLAAAPSVACYSAEHVPGLVLAWVALALVTVGVPVAAAAGFARSPSCGAREAGSRLSRCCTSSALRRCTTLTLVVVVSSALEDHGHAAARVVRMAVCCAALLADGATAWWLSHHCSRGAAGPGSAPAALHLGCSLAACGVAIGSSQPRGLPSPSVVVWASVAAALVLLLVVILLVVLLVVRIGVV